MKYFSTVFVTAAFGYRVFSDLDGFLANQDPEWNSKSTFARWTLLKIESDAFLDSYFTGENLVMEPKNKEKFKSIGNRLKNYFTDIRNDQLKARGRCTKKVEAKMSRVRRSFEVSSNPQTDFYNIFEQHATWIREEIYQSCPALAFRLLKRLDRLRLIYSWHYCHKVSFEIDFCTNWILPNQPHPRNDGVMNALIGRSVKYESLIGAKCTKSSDCRNGEECINGKCTENGTRANSCINSAQCDVLEICENNACIVPDFSNLIGRPTAFVM